MTARAQIVLSLHPASRSAVLRVTGPLPAGSAEEVRQVVHRAAGVAGPRVSVDLRECEHVDPAVLTCLMAAGSDLRARGGFLVCQGLAYPAGGGVVVGDGDGGHDGQVRDRQVRDGQVRRGWGAVDGVGPTGDVFDPGPGGRAVDGGGHRGRQGALAGLADGELARRTRALVRRRAEADAEPERSACGQELLDLLVEAGRRRDRSDLLGPELVPLGGLEGRESVRSLGPGGDG